MTYPQKTLASEQSFTYNIYILKTLILLNNMTKQNIKKEIEKLNSTIDLKIIKGLPYRAEARRHKFLMSQFNSFEKKSRASIFTKSFQVFASFIL